MNVGQALNGSVLSPGPVGMSLGVAFMYSEYRQRPPMPDTNRVSSLGGLYTRLIKAAGSPLAPFLVEEAGAGFFADSSLSELQSLPIEFSGVRRGMSARKLAAAEWEAPFSFIGLDIAGDFGLRLSFDEPLTLVSRLPGLRRSLFK